MHVMHETDHMFIRSGRGHAIHGLIIADFRLIKKWLLPKRGDKYIRILSRRNNFWLILHLLHIFMLIAETLNPRNKPILYAKLSKYESRKILFLQ